MISNDQIQRFFKKECSPEEAEKVAAWLKKHPEQAAIYLPETEWQDGQENETMPEEIHQEALHYINKKIKRAITITWLKRSAVAACVAACFAMGFLYTGKQTAALQTVSYHQIKNKTFASLKDTEYNYTRLVRRVYLTDGSVVSLFPNSAVWFDTPFAKKERNIHLTGEARFEVAKNKQKPFTVYAGLFSTTALGTEFIVQQQNNNLNVQLLHGKVVIKATGAAVPNWKNVYLAPGQQMTYNEKAAIARISNIEDKKTTLSIVPVTAKSNTQKETASNLMFTGSPVSAVLQKLSRYYNVSILFTSDDVKNISFTGTVAKKDSVENILKVITQMNGLTLAKTDSSFVVSKDNN